MSKAKLYQDAKITANAMVDVITYCLKNKLRFVKEWNGGHVMEKFQDGKSTQLAFERILEIDQTSTEELPGIEEMESLDPAILFQEGINNRLGKLGFNGDIDSVDCKIDFLRKQFQKNKVEPRVSDATLKNWMTKAASTSNDMGRENVFKLCFALEMSAEETAEFFLKAFLSRPYNYKKTNEAVYYFCLLNRINYAGAVRIITAIQNIPQSQTVEKEVNTEQIGYEIYNITDEAELIKYLEENRYSEEEQHYTSGEMIKSMLDSCFELAQKETQLTRGTAVTVKSVDALLDVIYDYDADSMRKKEKKTIQDSKFPKCVKANWIDRQAFHNIEKRRTRTEDVYRKALVLLKFYSYYADAYCKARSKNTEDEIDFRGYADDFEVELETVLAECGYLQLYKRNPFDWMILYCAAFPNPLSTFRDIVSKYFLDVVS